MSETVETAVPIGISGLFLTDRDGFSEISRLFSELYFANKKLHEVQVRLTNCNQHAWLTSFEKRCNRSHRNSNLELTSLAAKLENKKATLVAAIKTIEQKILELDPTALDQKTTLAGSTHPFLALPDKRRTLDEDVASRNAVIDLHLDKLDKHVCKILDEKFGLDEGRPSLGIPNRWVEKYDVKSFKDSYAKCPALVHTLISKRRRRRHLP
jgi:hypothetical protein